MYTSSQMAYAVSDIRTDESIISYLLDQYAGYDTYSAVEFYEVGLFQNFFRNRPSNRTVQPPEFFLYFANGGNGIAVLSSDSPTGPFTDPIQKPLVSRETPGCASVTWLLISERMIFPMLLLKWWRNWHPPLMSMSV